MRLLQLFPLCLALTACDSQKSQPSAVTEKSPAAPLPVAAAPKPDLQSSVVRINSTQQTWNAGQPWEKNPPTNRRALAAIIAPQRVITTAELVADATYLEFESTDGKHFAQAKVISVDYEANLALLAPSSEDEGKTLFEKSIPLALTTPPKIGQALDILQIEENGQSLLTPSTLLSINVSSNFLPGHSFLTYLVKASMQDATSSYSLPVLQDGKLAGILISYNAKDQICDVASLDIISHFLQASANGTYKGFPSLGLATAPTEDPSLRLWLKLTEDQGGLYVRTIRKGGAAEAAGIQKGDVILAIDGQPIDRRGYYQHPNYGSVLWGHLIRGQKTTGQTTTLSLLRAGQPLEITATLTREEENSRIVPGYTFGKAPNFLIKGGLIFQELTRPLLESFGENWQSRAPLNLLDAMTNPEKFEGNVRRVIFISRAIPTPATVGYENVRNLIVRKVNGQEIKDMPSLINAFQSNTSGSHSIEFLDEKIILHLDEATATAVDTKFLKEGLPRLFRSE